jgi:hypothetical protein
MSPLLQNILAITALILAVGFIITKFIWSPNKKDNKNCGGDDSCGCH